MFRRALARFATASAARYSTAGGAPRARRPRPILKATLLSASGGALVGAGYSVYTHYEVNKARLAARRLDGDRRDAPLAEKPVYEATAKVLGTRGAELELVLFQYANCPFCSKVRTFLDSRGYAYELVEVDALLKRGLAWSPYKKVPTAIVRGGAGDGAYRQLSDSSVIISALASLETSKGAKSIDELLACYPSVAVTQPDGKVVDEVLNKYFLMHGEAAPDRSDADTLRERRWRKWADDEFVHVISPNVYRTLEEARDTFEWYARAGRWRELFPSWEVAMMINVGAVAMYAIGKRLKRKHLMKDDVRLTLYDECNLWAKEIRQRGTAFMGGDEPDLSDLAVYGILSSVEGTAAFRDAIDNTRIKKWYNGVKEHVERNKGVMQTTRDGKLA